MSIPLDNLYNWVEGLLPSLACVYVFHPHGSKKISDFDWLRDYTNTARSALPGVIVHDQEPLDWNLYNCDYSDLERWKNWNMPSEFANIRGKCYSNFNLKSIVVGQSSQVYDQVVLIHSEKNSDNLTQYEQNGFICVHYWAHAVIARDWYRFAQFDSRLNEFTKPKLKFLIYCRDWSHRREYRLKFLEMLVKNELDHDSLTSIMHTNSDNVYFLQHKFLNPKFALTDPKSIFQIKNNHLSGIASANYDYCDFINTEISVVLETVFDESRIHLTEKTLRPIACGHPFILAAGPGSLEYIKSYGFKTFAPWIDESYDQETDSLERMKKIIISMKKIQMLQGQELEDFSQAVKSIAEFNKKYFFSNDFFNVLKIELKNNLDQACELVKRTRGKHYMELLKLLKNQNLVHQMPHRQELTVLLRQLRQSYPYDQSNPDQDLSA
jgi:hypothetical protein